MDREQIISFIEKIRPQIKEAGAPEEILLKAAREHNLAPAQLESTAQMLNTAQQLNFMDKAANRGDSFQLIDVPDLLSRFTQHETPKVASTKQQGAMEKAAYDDNSELPLRGRRLPNVNAKLLKDAGAAAPEVKIEPAPALPRNPRSAYREARAKAASLNYELQGVAQMIDDQREILRKSAEEVAYRLRTEPSFVWAEAKADALVLDKEATERFAPVVEDYLGQLTKHRKVAFSTEPATQTSILVDDRFNILPLIRTGGGAVEMIEKLAAYQEHVKSAAMTEPPGRLPRVENEEGSDAGNEDEDESDEDGGSSSTPPSRAPSNNAEDGQAEAPAPGAGSPMSSLEEIIFPPDVAGRGPGEINQDITQGVKDIMGAGGEALKRIPGPKTVHTEGMAMLEKLKPGRNAKQMKIDQGVEDVRTVTNLQRLMLTDPIIRDADPDMVLSLYNTIQNANPEMARDPNLLRFALREALQYESVPIHTYKDLVDTDEKKQKARETSGKNQDKRYAI